MNTIKFLGEQVIAKLSSLPDWDNLEDFVQEFQTMWLELGQTVQQNLVQQKIEAKLATLSTNNQARNSANNSHRRWGSLDLGDGTRTISRKLGNSRFLSFVRWVSGP